MKSYNAINVTRHYCVAFVLLMLALTTFQAHAQSVVRVAGEVVAKADHQPLTGVNISDARSQRRLAATDIDGKFAFNVHEGTTLRFSMVGFETKTVKVKSGQGYISVKLEEKDVTIKEVLVQAKRVTDKIVPEPTDIILKGNYLHVSTRVRVPREMFGHDTRLVVQPVLNNVTRGKLSLMRPMVYDAKEYNQTQDRLYNFNMNDSASGDPLAKYVTIKTAAMREKGRTNDIIGYNDSVYVDNVKDEYSCDVYMAIEDYTHILYRDTTVIARGTVNPLRWLDYSFAAKQITDPRYLPKPEKQLRDSRGEVNLRFPIGKATFSTDDPQNDSEIAKLQQQISDIAHSEGASLQSLSLEGTSSPDGKYASNLKLAQRRMDFAAAYMRSHLPADLAQGVKFQSTAKVAPWKDVVLLLRNDSLDAEAGQMEDILATTRDIDRQSAAMRRLPFYRSLLQAKYLPQLRKVNYTLAYSIMRTLTNDEILQLYKKDYRQLSRYEFYQLYTGTHDNTLREEYLRNALKTYPSFMAAANDLEVSLLSRGQSDETLLEPFVGKNAPQEVNCNQVIALLNAGHFTKADSVASFVEQTDDTRLLLAVNAVLNGRYDDYQTVAATGQRNECCLLLAMKRNEEAMKLAKQLPEGEALTHYLRAICLNRLDSPEEAYDQLKKAFELDPSLKKIAPVDGDVNNLLLDKEKDIK